MANARVFSARMLSLGLLQKTHPMCGMCDSFEVNVSIAAEFTGARLLNDDFVEVLPSVFRGIHMDKTKDCVLEKRLIWPFTRLTSQPRERGQVANFDTRSDARCTRVRF